MDFRRLLGTVILTVLLHPGYAFKLNGQRICRRGTERPCYKIQFFADVRRRLGFEEARRACRGEAGGELLSVGTESEQRLVERFMQQIGPADGDFWIGLRRRGAGAGAGAGSGQRQGCASQYRWLDGSLDSFRNWRWGEPSCVGGERCVVLRHQASAPPNEGRPPLLFTWSDEDCSYRNNFVCKYSEEKVPAFTVAGNTIRTAAPNLSLRPNLRLVTESDETTNIRVSESSVLMSERGPYVNYILFGTLPLLLLLLLGATGVFCFRRAAKRRKTQADGGFPSSSRPDPWLSAGPPGPPRPSQAPPPYPPIQGPYASSDVTKLPLSALGGGGTASPDTHTHTHAAPQSEDYENLPSRGTASGFVTNDIYETCRGRGQTGWAENEIYG